MEADLPKDLYRIGTKNGILNSWYARNQFSTCREGTVNIADVPSVNISSREYGGKASLFRGQGYRRCNCKTSHRSNLCSCRKSNMLCNSNVTIVYRTKMTFVLTSCFTFLLFCFSFIFITSWCNEKLLLFISLYKILVHM